MRREEQGGHAAVDLQRLIGQEGLGGSGRARQRRRLLALGRRAGPLRLLPVHALLAGDALLGGRRLRRQRVGVEAFAGPPADDLLAVVLLDDVQGPGRLQETGQKVFALATRGRTTT